MTLTCLAKANAIPLSLRLASAPSALWAFLTTNELQQPLRHCACLQILFNTSTHQQALANLGNPSVQLPAHGSQSLQISRLSVRLCTIMLRNRVNLAFLRFMPAWAGNRTSVGTAIMKPLNEERGAPPVDCGTSSLYSCCRRRSHFVVTSCLRASAGFLRPARHL